MFCPSCGAPAPAGHDFCTSCGAPVSTGRSAVGGAEPAPRGGPGLAITGMVLGILLVLTIAGLGGVYTADEHLGLLTFSVGAVSFSAFGLSGQRSGKGMAIAGLVMGILGLVEWLSVFA